MQVRLWRGKHTDFCKTLLKLLKCCSWKPVLNFVGFLIYIFPVGDGSDTGTLERATHWVTLITHYGCLKCSRRGKKSHKPTQNAQSPLLPGPLNQCRILLFYRSLLDANLSASVLGVCFSQTQKGVLLGAFTRFLYHVWQCWVKLPSAGWLPQGSHTWALPHLHHPLQPTGSSRAYSVLKFRNQRKIGPKYL